MKNKILSSRRRGTLILIPALAVALAVSGCAKKGTPSPVVNNNNNTQQVNQNTNTNANLNQNTNSNTSDGSGVVKNGEEIDMSDWQTYRNEEYGFEVKYPPYLKKTEVVGEFYKGEEYPRIGVSFLDPKSERGTFKEVGLTIYDEGWVGLGPDLFDPQIFDFNKVAVKDIIELKNKNEFSTGEIISIKNISILKVEKNYNLYLIFQNPKNSKFLVFSTINNQEGDEYKEINKYREKLMMEVLGTINFIKK